MTIEAVEIHPIFMPLARLFEPPVGHRPAARDVLLVHVRTDVADGWGECVALTDPTDSSEYAAGAEAVLRDFLLPALLDAPDTTAAGFGTLVASVRGHRAAKAALEMAILDAELRAAGRSFAEYFGGVRSEVDCGVSVGRTATIDDLVDQVVGYVDEGYRRVKLKIAPGWDLEPARAVRDALGGGALLQVDAGAAYTVADIDHLRGLDRHGLLFIEQPFAVEDIAAHILLARAIDTPVCLGESIVSVEVAVDAIERSAAGIVNVKAGRLGGYHEAMRVHDACAELNVPVWCGGMLETGIGRAANVALAAMENFTLPGDTAASNRYFTEDLTEPFVMNDGRLSVPTGPGLGVTVREDLVRTFALGEPLVVRSR